MDNNINNFYIDMDELGLRQLFNFKYGIPSVYGVMLGDVEGKGRDVQWHFEEREIDDPKVLGLLDDYNISVEFYYGECEFIDKIQVYIPLDCLTEEDIKSMYSYFCKAMNFTDSGAQFEYDDDGDLKKVDIHVYDMYFNITMKIEHFETAELIITIEGSEDDYRLYKTLSYIAREGDEDFMNYVRSIRK